MVSDRPLVSVVVPSFNQGSYIEQTLRSILDQDYRPIEILVMDGASTDDTLAVLHRYDHVPEVNWISEKDDGVVDAVNKGFAKARGEICAIQSSDDLYLPGALSRVVAAFRDNPETGLVFGDVRGVDASGTRVLRERRFPDFSLERLLGRGIYLPQPTTFFLLDLAKQCGGWDERFPYVADANLYLKIAFRTSVTHVGEVLGAIRYHPERRDHQSQRIFEEHCRMVDTSPEIASAGRRLRSAAEAGKMLIKLRYGQWTDMELTRALWRAVLCHPACLTWGNVPRHRLVPGYFAVTAWIGRMRRRAGCLVRDVPRLRKALRGPVREGDPRDGWIMVRNRNQVLSPGPDGRGARCEWTGGAVLHVARVFPGAGPALLRRALQVWPIRFTQAMKPTGSGATVPVTIVIGHRGADRLPLLLKVLDSIAGQAVMPAECIVVEQDTEHGVRDRLPPWVRTIHAPSPDAGMLYNRAWALNVGARAAQGELLVLHDSDLLMPAAYVSEVWERYREGYEVVRLARFVFYADEESTDLCIRGECEPAQVVVERVRQNTAGGTLAVSRKAFIELGGMDEEFVGWGCEDDEFLDRASTRKTWDWTYLPVLHLRHARQPDWKAVRGRGEFTHAVMDVRSTIPPDARIAELLTRRWGEAGGPDPEYRNAVGAIPGGEC